MKIFEKGKKINFVDKNNIFVGFDYSQDCCEDFGYLITKTQPDIVEYENNETLDESSLNLDEYVFNKDYIKSINAQDEGGAVSFMLVSGDKVLYLTLFNHHNGYYGHGFEVFDNNFMIKKGCL